MKEVLVKPGRCMGCRQCTFACAVAHSQSHEPLLAILEDPPPSSRIDVRVGRAGKPMPVKCRHCKPAPCESACPSGAMARTASLGLVLVDANRCAPCLSCAKACPFEAVAYRKVRTDQGIRMAALKCDGCVERVVAGAVPACVAACKSGALVFTEREVVRPKRREMVVAPPAGPSAPFVQSEQQHADAHQASPQAGHR